MGHTTIDITGDTGKGLESLERALWLAFNSHGENTIAESYWVGRLKPSVIYYGGQSSAHQQPNVIQGGQTIPSLQVNHMEHTATDPEGRMTLILCRELLHPNPGQAPLPFRLNKVNVTGFIQQWLGQQSGNIGDPPDTDGSVQPNGWRVYVKHGYSDGANGPSNGLVAIEARWTIYGK